jgi:hypothetical protein
MRRCLDLDRIWLIEVELLQTEICPADNEGFSFVHVELTEIKSLRTSREINLQLKWLNPDSGDFALRNRLWRREWPSTNASCLWDR